MPEEDPNKAPEPSLTRQPETPLMSYEHRSMGEHVSDYLESYAKFCALAFKEEFSLVARYKSMKWLYLLIVFIVSGVIGGFLGIPYVELLKPIFRLLSVEWWIRLSLAGVILFLLFLVDGARRFNERTVRELNDKITDLTNQLPAKDGLIERLQSNFDSLATNLKITKLAMGQAKGEFKYKISTLKSERDSLKAQLEERNKQKLFLFVDTEKGVTNPSDLWETFESKASLYRDSTTFNLEPNKQIKSIRFMLWADFIIFFENQSTDRVSIRTVKVLLMRVTRRGREKEIRYRNAMPLEVNPITSAPLTLDGWPVEGMTITPPLILNCKLELSSRVGQRLDQNCFFRISVDTISHPQINVDLDVDWEKTRNSNGMPVQITPRTSAQYQVHR